MQDRWGTRGRGGFSLVELMIVLVIIGILMSLLLAGVNSAMYRARVAAAVGEVKNLEKAIADFKLKLGVEPPSFLVLYEQGTATGAARHWGTDTAFPWTDAARRSSRAFLRQTWPSFDFTTMGDPAGSAVGPRNPIAANGSIDINGDGDETDVLVLNGAECLAFLLGGLQEPIDTNGDGTNDAVGVRGFSANPASPFLTLTGNRIGPFYEFAVSRFVDADPAPDGIFEYLDAIPGQQKPLQYFSSYSGRGYQLNGLDGVAGTDDDEVILLSGGVQTMNSVYLQSSGASPTPFNQNTYQIISPGYDLEYGGPGPYPGPPLPNIGGLYDGKGIKEVWRRYEKDNITNFKGGELN